MVPVYKAEAAPVERQVVVEAPVELAPVEPLVAPVDPAVDRLVLVDLLVPQDLPVLVLPLRSFHKHPSWVA